MAGLFSSPSPPPAPAPLPAPLPAPRPENRDEQENAAAARARRLSARPLVSGSPLGVQEQLAGGLATTLGPSRATG